MRTERNVPRRLFGIDTDARLEPLAVLVDERHKSDWRLADVRSQQRDVVEGEFRRRVKDVVAMQRGETQALVRQGDSGVRQAGRLSFREGVDVHRIAHLFLAASPEDD